jgi:hypothetical protein
MFQKISLIFRADKKISEIRIISLNPRSARVSEMGQYLWNSSMHKLAVKLLAN